MYEIVDWNLNLYHKKKFKMIDPVMAETGLSYVDSLWSFMPGSVLSVIGGRQYGSLDLTHIDHPTM